MVDSQHAVDGYSCQISSTSPQCIYFSLVDLAALQSSPMTRHATSPRASWGHRGFRTLGLLLVVETDCSTTTSNANGWLEAESCCPASSNFSCGNSQPLGLDAARIELDVRAQSPRRRDCQPGQCVGNAAGANKHSIRPETEADIRHHFMSSTSDGQRDPSSRS